jgi:acyl-CoA reductase-like NAD-dependent aldehyde dehydrogenase
VSIAREVLSETGFDPNVVTLAVEGPDEPIAATLATDPRVAIIDFTGSTDFGEWLEDNARQALVYTEKAGVNSVILESTDDYRGVLGNLAFTLSLYTGQMCTTTQNIYVPRDGVAPRTASVRRHRSPRTSEPPCRGCSATTRRPPGSSAPSSTTTWPHAWTRPAADRSRSRPDR